MVRRSLMVPMMRIVPVCACASAWFTEKKLDAIRPVAISGTICG